MAARPGDRLEELDADGVVRAPESTGPPEAGAPAGTAVRLPSQTTEHVVDELRDVLYRAVGERQWVVVDAAGVTYLSHAAVGVLIAAALLAQQSGGGLVLDSPSAAVRNRLRAFRGTRELFEVRQPAP